MLFNEEEKRIHESTNGPFSPWKKWGAYVSERAWGTVREDYSADGDAWRYTTHDMARSRAFRWGEDGIAGLSDFYQSIIFSLAFWNGKDPILKERLFGLNPYEGNHGEDVKECYYYLDATPTQSYMKFLYKYPHAEFPYENLIQVNQSRTAQDREYELIDTGVFKENRYFDIFIEYAKASQDDICIRIEVFNRGPEPAAIHVIPQLTFRNRWSWNNSNYELPEIIEGKKGDGYQTLFAHPKGLPTTPFYAFDYFIDPLNLYGQEGADLLFTNNETNNEKIWNTKSRTPYVKDGFHRHIINNELSVNPENKGSKACFHYPKITIDAGASHVIRLRLSKDVLASPIKDVDAVIEKRFKEANEFYDSIQSKKMSADDRLIQRQALAGMLWSQQLFLLDIEHWLKGDNPDNPPPPERMKIRNFHWLHFFSNAVISMPDKWEYPWFAAWDLAFQSVVLSIVDQAMAKEQLYILLSHQYMHPNGQIPAYEWNFSDLNPPAQAWALWRIYQRDIKQGRTKDTQFLEKVFLKLMENFNWWVNKVDRIGNNFFEGGFLGLDNISVIDRSVPLPWGGYIEQSDGTGWMAFFALKMMRIALELSKTNEDYQDTAVIFFEHFVYIAAAMQKTSPKLLEKGINMWDEDDGFFYDVISYPDGTETKLKVRSFVGLIPFLSIDFITEEELQALPRFYDGVKIFIKHSSEYMLNCCVHMEDETIKGYMLSVMTTDQMQRVLKRVFDEDEFLSNYGLRSLSKYHEKNPLIFHGSDVGYEPGESTERIKGGNSNWRGPIWMPVNVLFIDALNSLEEIFGEKGFVEFKGQKISVKKASNLLADRLIDLFRKKGGELRPIHTETDIYKTDVHWHDLILFYEHFHGDNGRGLGASHQTGWSGLVANLIEEWMS
ncbi:MAG: glucosidase [Parachlamydiales bacterium]|nr:glucosidase [Parachlamydiales bacterium]